MDLPIDLVPNTSPPRFRWKRTVSTLNGTSTVQCEGTVPPQLECALADLIALVKGQAKEIEKLRGGLAPVQHDATPTVTVPTPVGLSSRGRRGR